MIVDGALTELGAELRWDDDWDRPLRPWRVEDPTGRLRLELTPRYDKHTRVSAVVLGTETHQVFGTWSGSLVVDAGETLELFGLQGLAEESRSRW